ncbi:unnamed protein product, partial [Linum tenue]
RTQDDDSLRRWKEKLLGSISGELNGRLLFTLREGSQYQLKFTFTVLHNIVSGLTYSNTVWKSGIQVDQNKGMLGTFAPQREPYVHTLEEETTPSGILARGTYSAKLKVSPEKHPSYVQRVQSKLPTN